MPWFTRRLSSGLRWAGSMPLSSPVSDKRFETLRSLLLDLNQMAIARTSGADLTLGRSPVAPDPIVHGCGFVLEM